MKLSDLRPKAVTFEAVGLELTFRPFTIADDLKGQDLCGGQEAMAKAFADFDFEKISLVAWYQLDLESQKKIVDSVSGSYIDPETGNEVDANLTPIQKFRQLFIGIEGQISLITNLIKTKGLNIPDMNDEEELKKWVDQLEAAIQPTGP